MTILHITIDCVPWMSDKPDSETSIYSTQHSIVTDIHAFGRIRTRNLKSLTALDLRLRPGGHWDRLFCYIYRYSQHKDLSVNDEPRIRRWSHNTIGL